MSSQVVMAQRRRWFLGLLSLGAVLAAFHAASAFLDGQPLRQDDRYGTRVFSDVDALIASTAQISVTLADETYTLVSNGAGWFMDTSEGFPIRNDRLATLAEALKSMQWDTPRTSDPRKHDRIGVGDPASGGNGAQVYFMAQDGAVLASLVTGRRGENIYARRPGEPVAYRVAGDLPPFYSRDAWMDFGIVEIEPETIHMVEIRDRFGDRVVLSRRAGAGPDGFAPAPPYLDSRLLTPLSAGGPALSLSRFAPLDAKPVSRLSTEPVARLVTITFDGLELIAEAYDEPDGGYITLRGVEAGGAAARARSINVEARDWAFKLPDLDYRDMTTPVSSIVVADR